MSIEKRPSFIGKVIEGTPEQERDLEELPAEAIEPLSEQDMNLEVIINDFESRYFNILEEKARRSYQLYRLEQEEKNPDFYTQTTHFKESLEIRKKDIDEAVEEEREFCHQMLGHFLNWIEALKKPDAQQPLTVLWDVIAYNRPALPLLLQYQAEMISKNNLDNNLLNGVISEYAAPAQQYRKHLNHRHPNLVSHLDNNHVYSAAKLSKKEQKSFSKKYNYQDTNGRWWQLLAHHAGELKKLIELQEKGDNFIIVSTFQDVVRAQPYAPIAQRAEIKPLFESNGILITSNRGLLYLEQIEGIDNYVLNLKKAKEKLMSLLDSQGSFKRNLGRIKHQEKDEVVKLRNQVRQLLQVINTRLEKIETANLLEQSKITSKDSIENIIEQAEEVVIELDEYFEI